jgi:hypothetical protein
MKKTIYTLQVDNYMPEMTKITFKYMQIYADKIGANFKVITERKFPDMPVTYEKFQIYEIGQEDGNDWNIYLDADAFINPEAIDFTNFINKDTVLNYNKDFSNIRFRHDKYFTRDGRNIGCGNWFTVVSDLCIDLWKPLDDITVNQAIENIYPVMQERTLIGMKKDHLIDDYVTSRNVAKYGLKHTTVVKLVEDYKLPSHFFWHDYKMKPEEKLTFLKDIIEKNKFDEITDW